MTPFPREDNESYTIGMGCGLPSAPAIECTAADDSGKGLPAAPPTSKARLAGRVKSYLKSSFGKGDDSSQNQPAAADECFGESLPTLLDSSCESESPGIGSVSQHHTSALSSLSAEDALALEVGQIAHEYLEECFHYTKVRVLNRAKFNAVPEVAKADFAIKSHLGKGTYSDVFHVVCEGGSLFRDTKNTIPDVTEKDGRGRSDCDSTETEQDGRRRPSGKRLALSNSINVATGAGKGRRRRSSKRLSFSSSINVAALLRPSAGDDPRNAYAIKCLRPQIRSDFEQFTIGAQDLVAETALLANLDHRHIVKLHGRASGRLTDAFVLNDGYFIVLDKLDETLKDRMKAWRKTVDLRRGPSVQQLEVAHSIADAVAYLHSKDIAFRDLKPDNVGFDRRGVVKLFDFGFATGLPERDGANPAGFLFERCGTHRYMAPEMGLSLGYRVAADVYSFGILLWELSALTEPLSSITSPAAFEESVFIGGMRPAVDERWPEDVKELIGKCWSSDPGKRPRMPDVKAALSLAIFRVPEEEGAGGLSGHSSDLSF